MTKNKTTKIPTRESRWGRNIHFIHSKNCGLIKTHSNIQDPTPLSLPLKNKVSIARISKCDLGMVSSIITKTVNFI